MTDYCVNDIICEAGRRCVDDRAELEEIRKEKERAIRYNGILDDRRAEIEDHIAMLKEELLELEKDREANTEFIEECEQREKEAEERVDSISAIMGLIGYVLNACEELSGEDFGDMTINEIGDRAIEEVKAEREKKEREEAQRNQQKTTRPPRRSFLELFGLFGF